MDAASARAIKAHQQAFLDRHPDFWHIVPLAYRPEPHENDERTDIYLDGFMVKFGKVQKTGINSRQAGSVFARERKITYLDCFGREHQPSH